MSRYGIDYYGLTPYGVGTGALIEFDASPFVAKSIDYGKIQLTWTSPSGDWDRIRLVRNTYGFPLSVDDGVIVYEEPKNFDSGLYIDDGQIPDNIGLKEGRAYHYSLFVLNVQSNQWIKSNNAAAIAIKNYGTFNYMYDNLPAIYKITNLNTITDVSDNKDLEAFIRIFSTTYDLFKTNTEILLNTYDTSTAYFPIIPTMMQQFGVSFEPEIGLQQSRILLRNAVYINKLKGSRLGITGFVKAFTGYDEITLPSRNLMLDYNDSSFEESIGRWEEVEYATLSRTTTPTAPLEPYQEPTLPTSFPNKAVAVLKVETEVTGDAVFACGLAAPKTRGVPVKEGFSYTFSIYSAASDATKTKVVNVDIIWFDKDGAELSRAGEQFATNAYGVWTRVSTTSVAPVNAFFAVPQVRIAGTEDEDHHYFDAAQLEESSEGPTAFEEARELQIILKASRVNELINPSFEINVTPWTSLGANISQDLIISDDANGSDVSMLIEATTDDEVTIKYDNFIDVIPSFYYSASAHFRTGFTGDLSEDYLGQWKVEWYDANQSLISTDAGDLQPLTEFYGVEKYTRIEDVLTVFTTEVNTLEIGQQVRLLGFEDLTINGEYTVTLVSGRFFQVESVGDNIPTTAATNANLVQDLAIKFARSSYTFLTPENAQYAKLLFVWDNPVLGQELRMDTAMFERATIAKPYFDGGTGFSSSEDLIWEGGVHSSRSHYYKNRVANQLRLVEKLPEFLTHGTTFTLFLAQPNNPE
jgi:hypothetical protein